MKKERNSRLAVRIFLRSRVEGEVEKSKGKEHIIYDQVDINTGGYMLYNLVTHDLDPLLSLDKVVTCCEERGREGKGREKGKKEEVLKDVQEICS